MRDFAFIDVKDPEKQDEAGTTWNQPFLHEIKPFPIHVTRTDTANVTIEDPSLQEPIRPGFPKFAPFPPIHTYKQTENNQNPKKRNRDSSENASSSKQRHASSVKSIQKSLSRIEDAIEEEALKKRKDISILSDPVIQRIMEESKTGHPRMLDVPFSAGKPDKFDINKVPPEKIQSLTREQKLLCGIYE